MNTEQEKKLAAQKEAAFRAAFSNGVLEIGVAGPIALSVMQWGVEREYVRDVGGSKPTGEEIQAMHMVGSSALAEGTVKRFRLTVIGRDFITKREGVAHDRAEREGA